jgi:choline-sulfatase
MLNSGRFVYHARNDINTVPLWGETLGEAGYATFLTGKWHNGQETALRSFQQARSVGKGMFETRGGSKGNGYRRPAPDRVGWEPYDKSLLGHWSPEVWDILPSDSGGTRGEPYVVEQHTSELYADQAIAFLEQHTKTANERPFFMYVAFNAPHDPRQSPREFVDQYPAESLPLPQSYLDEHPFDQGERNTLRDEILAPFPRTPEVVRTHMQEYYAIVTHMDQQIGRILAALEASGQADNTYLFFTADHGLAVGRHGLMGKQNQYDHSIRVPLLIVGPDIPANHSSDALVYLQSIYPTSCELAGVAVPPSVEFPSLRKLIQNETDSGQAAIFGSYKDFQRMIRTDRHKLILYPEAKQVQLFDIQKDPNELTNLANDPTQQEVVQNLFEQLLTLQQEVGDTLVLAESLLGYE